MTTHPVAWRSTARAALIIAALIAVALVPNLGCSYFKPSTKANVSPFSDQTMAMSENVDTSLSGGRLIYTRHLTTGPEAAKYKALLLELQDVIKGIVAYSFQAVTVAESGLSASQKTDEMANFIQGLVDHVDGNPSARFSLTQASIDTLISHVRQADDLVGALRAAQPLADDAGTAAMGIINELQVQLGLAEEELTAKLVERHGAMLVYSNSFKRQQSYVLTGLTLVDEYWRTGNKETLAAARDSVPLFFEGMPPPSQMTLEHVVEVEERLFGRLKKMDDARQSIAWDVDMYFKQMQEIDRVVESTEKTLRVARVAIHVWVKTHRKLSAGITTPAMFDMFEITKSLVGSVL